MTLVSAIPLDGSSVRLSYGMLFRHDLDSVCLPVIRIINFSFPAAKAARQASGSNQIMPPGLGSR